MKRITALTYYFLVLLIPLLLLAWSENAEQVAVIGEWLVGTDVGAALQEMRDANWSADEAKQALAAVKRKLAKAMNS